MPTVAVSPSKFSLATRMPLLRVVTLVMVGRLGDDNEYEGEESTCAEPINGELDDADVVVTVLRPLCTWEERRVQRG